MRIGLYNLEQKIVNTALMQVSQYHKQLGDRVEMYHPLMHDTYDKIYAFSLFNFTDKSYVSGNMICGGTGFDLTTKLPKEIEICDYDWSCYPDCNYSIVWFSRGCIRNCPFCVVREKEGLIYSVDPKNLNPRAKIIKVQDNNFFANKDWKKAVEFLKNTKQKILFDSGIDIRLINEEQARALKSLRIQRYLHFAWDNPKDDPVKNIELLKNWIPASNMMCYILIGYWSTEQEDLYRIETLRRLNIDPFVMPFNKSDPYQQMLARYVNRKEIFKSSTWQEYKNGIRH